MTAAPGTSGTDRSDLAGQTVVVIGASAGIGLETARQVRAGGGSVVLVGRNPERLQQAALESYGELHELEPTGDASAALARLHSSQGAHVQAAKWLELRLGHLPEHGRAGTMLELAQASAAKPSTPTSRAG